ncbi:MAG: hypothetical protein ACE5G9_08970 [Nitrospinales bacterium]
MHRFLEKFRGSYLRNDQGIAALMGVIIALVIVATLAFGFWAEVQQKQAGGAVSYTSTNAFLLAEAGIRYAEKCILASNPVNGSGCACGDLGCTCNSTNGCVIDNTLNSVTINKTFGNGRGSFHVVFLVGTSSFATATSVGTFAGAQREFKKVLCLEAGCPLSESPITACTKLEISNNASSNVPIPDPPPVCPDPPLVDPLVFPEDPAGCPNAAFPDFIQATTPSGHLMPPDGNGFQELIPSATSPDKFQYCNMTISGSAKVKTPSNTIIWVGKDFKLKNNAVFLGNGTVEVNVGQKAELKNVSDVRAADGGSVTIHTDGDFVMKNSSGANNVGDGVGTPDPDPASLIVLVGNNAKIKNSATLIGAIIANNKIELDNNALLNGSIMADQVELESNATIIFSPTAGSGAAGIVSCKSGSSSGGGGGGGCPTVRFVP